MAPQSLFAAAAAAIALSMSGCAKPIAAEPLPESVQTNAPDGAALYEARCASCHEGGSDRAPRREVLSRNPPSFMARSMRTGAMAPMAQGLSPAEAMAIARYVSETDNPGDVHDVDPAMIWGEGVDDTPLDAPRCESAPPPVDLDSEAQWNGWSVRPDNARFQPNPGLSAAEVPRLRLRWAFNYPGAKNGQATVIGERLFVTSMSGAVYALNARTGCVYWRHAAPAATRTSVTIAELPDGAPARHALFYSDWTKSAVALDADTGQVIWRTVIDDQPGTQMTGAITYWDGMIFVPISSGNEAFARIPNWICCRFRGALVALDAASGRILWKRYTTEREPRPYRRNSAGNEMWGPSGGAIWVAPTIDPERRLLYVGTSNSYTEVEYDNADSVLAIDIDTGRIRWARQLTPDDNYVDGCWGEGHPNCPSPLGPDFSIGASPMLRTLPDGQQLLIVGQKSGMVYALDPARQGARVWERRVGAGSALGGVEFGLAADNERVYAGVSDIVAPDRGRPGLWALDLRTGEPVWNQPTSTAPTCRWANLWCHGAISQAISVMPGVVFAGSYDGHFRAYDAETGRIIWDFDTGTAPVRALNGRMVFGGVMDGAGPTIVGGMVYVHSGYAGRSGGAATRDMVNAEGNVLMAFSVDGD